MTGTNCDLFTHKSSRSYLNYLVFPLPNSIQIGKKYKKILIKFNLRLYVKYRFYSTDFHEIYKRPATRFEHI
jgi:hypothetical protein